MVPGKLLTVGALAFDKQSHVLVSGDKYRVSVFATVAGGAGDAACPGTYGTYITYYGNVVGAGNSLGQFNAGPGAVAVDNYGNIWVSDNGDARIEMYNPTTNSWTGQVGCDGVTGCGGSPVNGKISTGVAGIAFDKLNNMWIVDTNNNRVEELTINYNNVTGGSGGNKDMGTWVQTIGGGTPNGVGSYICAGGYVNNTTCSLTNGNTGTTSATQSPNTYSSLGCCPNAFSDTGVAINCSCGSSSGLGNFNGPTAIAIDPDGTSVWVADNNNHRLQKFVISGATSRFAQEIGGSGNAGATCNTAYGCSADASHCASTAANICTSNSSCACFPGNWSNSGVDSPTAIAFDPQGNLWVTDNSSHLVEEYNPAIAGITATPGTANNGTGAFINGATGSWGKLNSFGNYGLGVGQFQDPEGLAISR